MMKTLIPDVHVWLALTFDSHVHHAAAKAWFDAIEDGLCLFCRTTQQGFLRLASNAAVFGDSALTLNEAWKVYDILQSDPRVSFVDEPIGIELPWRQFTDKRTASPKVWMDAYLAALAKTGNFDLVSFDRGLLQYADVRSTILS